ncbi:MAG: thioredoxin family protein [Deltaproteobacteria bacterium]|nr:thioredoxin family protein [Deltaproteobacteria bacterium]
MARARFSCWGLCLLCGCGPSATWQPPPLEGPIPVPPAAAAGAPAAPVGPAAAGAGATPAHAAPAAPSGPALTAIEDNVPAARRQAAAEGKLLLVEIWAPWCHTCLSMRSYVLTDPALRPLGERVVLAGVDTDRPENAAFLDRHEVTAWPTLFVLDPKTDEVLGLWQGAASVGELRGFVQGAADARDEAGAQPQSPLSFLLRGKRAQARGDYRDAAENYARAIERSEPGWARRAEAAYGLLHSQYRRGRWEACARTGVEQVASIAGAALPADFASYLLECAARLPGTELARGAREQALARLRAHVESPPPESSVDDRADALSILSDALRAAGDAAGARQATQGKLDLLEHAAARAPTAEIAATFDYGRMNAYLELGRGEDAVRMLEQRRRELPDAYEPAARLAQALVALGRLHEAQGPLDEALQRSYGPRRLRYLRMRVDLLGHLGERAAQLESARALVAGYEALSPAERARPPQREGLAEAQRLLGRLQAGGR